MEGKENVRIIGVKVAVSRTILIVRVKSNTVESYCWLFG